MAGTGTAKPRIDWIDSVKGMTIILVVHMHATLGTGEALGHMPPLMGTLAEFVMPFRMPLFFLVAGLFAARALAGDLREFIDGKIVHFAYFYLLWSAIQLGLKFALGGAGNHPVTLQDVLLVPVEPFSTLWFIYALAVFFAVTRIARNVPKPILFAAALALYFSGLHTGWTIPDEFAQRYVFFLSGVFGAPYIFQIAGWARFHPLKAVTLALALLASVGTVVFSGLVALPPFALLMGYGGALAAIMLVSILAAKGLARPLAYTGAHSLHIYLAFFLPMAAARITLVKLGIGNGDLVAFAATAAGVLLPLIAFRLVGKTPLAFLFVRPAAFRLGGAKGAHPAAKAGSARAAA